LSTSVSEPDNQNSVKHASYRFNECFITLNNKILVFTLTGYYVISKDLMEEEMEFNEHKIVTIGKLKVCKQDANGTGFLIG